MRAIPVILLIIAAAFFAYAMVTQFKNTDSTQPTLKRVQAAIVAAGMALGAGVTSFVTDLLNR